MLAWVFVFLPLLSIPQLAFWGLCRLLAPRHRPLHLGALVWLLATDVLWLYSFFDPAVAKRFDAVSRLASEIIKSVLHLIGQVGDGGFLISISGPAVYALPVGVAAALLKWLSVLPARTARS
jgi:hypothetical protein